MEPGIRLFTGVEDQGSFAAYLGEVVQTHVRDGGAPFVRLFTPRRGDEKEEKTAGTNQPRTGIMKVKAIVVGQDGRTEEVARLEYICPRGVKGCNSCINTGYHGECLDGVRDSVMERHPALHLSFENDRSYRLS